jgi:hypothetical protein
LGCIEAAKEFIIIFIEVNVVFILRDLLELLGHAHLTNKLQVVCRIILWLSGWSIDAHNVLKSYHVLTIFHLTIRVHNFFAVLHHQLLLHFAFSTLLNSYSFLLDSIFLDAIHKRIKRIFFVLN